MMLIFPRKLLTLLGGLFIIMDFANAGMVPIGNPKPAVNRPPVAKPPISTPGINQNPNSHRPDRPSSISATAQPPVTFGIMQQKPPSSYSSSQSSAGNSQSHLIFTQNTVGDGNDPVMIVTSTLSAVNETENTHNVPLEEMSSVFGSILNTPLDEISPEVVHQELLSVAPLSTVTQENIESSSVPSNNIIVSVSSLDHNHNPQNIQNQDPIHDDLPVISANPVTNDQYEPHQNPSNEPLPSIESEPSPSISYEISSSVSNELAESNPIEAHIQASNEIPTASHEPLPDIQLELLPNSEQPSSIPEDLSPTQINEDTVPTAVNVPPSPQSSSDVSPPAPSPSNGIMPNPSIQEDDHHFDIDQYLAQASLALGGTTYDDSLSSEVSELPTGNSVDDHAVFTSVEELPQVIPPATSLDENAAIDEHLPISENEQLSVEAPISEPLPLPIAELPIMEPVENEVLAAIVAPAPEYASNTNVDDNHANIGTEEFAEQYGSDEVAGILEEQILGNDSPVENVIAAIESENLVNHVEQIDVNEQMEVSHDTPSIIPDVNEQSVLSDAQNPSNENIPEHSVDNIEEQLMETPEGGLISPANPPIEISAPVIEAVVPEPVEVNDIPGLEDSSGTTLDESNDILQVHPAQGDNLTEYTSLSNAAETPVNHNTHLEENGINDEEDPPFNVEQYLAQAALILGGSSHYQPYKHVSSPNEMYYSDRHINKQPVEHSNLLNKNNDAGGDGDKRDQYYIQPQVSETQETNKASDSSLHHVPASIQNENEIENAVIPNLDHEKMAISSIGLEIPSTNKEDTKSSDEVLSHKAPAQEHILAVPLVPVLQPVQSLPPLLQQDPMEKNVFLTLPNPESQDVDEYFFATDANAQNVGGADEHIDAPPLVDHVDSSLTAAELERARPPKPGLSRPSAQGLTPVYTYSGGKLNTPIGDNKLTHGSLSTANSKNQNGTFSMLHEAGKAPQHSMVSLLGSSAFNSYFNGSLSNTVPTNTASFTLAQAQSPNSISEPEQPPKIQHAVLNNTNVVGTLDAPHNKPNNDPTPYHNYYFPQDSVKLANILINNGVRPVVSPPKATGPEVSLISQLESEVKSFPNDLDMLRPGQSVLDLLSQDRKKASGINSGNSHLVKRTSASGKSLEKNGTAPDKTHIPIEEENKEDMREKLSEEITDQQEDNTKEQVIEPELQQNQEQEGISSTVESLAPETIQSEEKEEFATEDETEEFEEEFQEPTIKDKTESEEEEAKEPTDKEIVSPSNSTHEKKDAASADQEDVKVESSMPIPQKEHDAPNSPKETSPMQHVSSPQKDYPEPNKEINQQQPPEPVPSKTKPAPQKDIPDASKTMGKQQPQESVPNKPSAPLKDTLEDSSKAVSKQRPEESTPNKPKPDPVKETPEESSKAANKQRPQEPEPSKANPTKENPPERPPSPPTQKDAGPPSAAGPSGPSLPQPPPAPTLVAPPPIPEAMSAPSLLEITIPEPNFNTPNVPMSQDISDMIGTVNIPPIPTFGDNSKASSSKGLPASPGKPKPPKRPNSGPGKGNSQQGSNPSSPQQSVAPASQQPVVPAPQQSFAPEPQQPIAQASKPAPVVPIVQQQLPQQVPEELAISEEMDTEENEMEVSEDEEGSSSVSYNVANEDTRQQSSKEPSTNTEKALPSKHGRPFPPGFGNPNPLFANSQPHGPPFQNAPTPVTSSSASTSPDKACSCNASTDNKNNNPNINPTPGGKNNPNEINNGGSKNNNTPSTPSKHNANAAAPAPTQASSNPSPPVIDAESEEDSNVRPPRPSKPKRPVRPNGGNKKPKPKPSGDKNSEKLKDVEVEDDIENLMFQQDIANIDSQKAEHSEGSRKPVQTVTVESVPIMNNSSTFETPVKQTQLLQTISVFGWEIPVGINWSYFTDVFKSFFVEKFRMRSGAGEFTCDESDNDVPNLRSELEVDYLCGDDTDYSRRDIRTRAESNICNMFCNTNGYSGGMCLLQKSCLCYMSDAKDFAIKLDRLEDYNNNSTEKVPSDSEDVCQNCRCLKSCQNHGKYVGYCSKSCHCGVPWYNRNSNPEDPPT